MYEALLFGPLSAVLAAGLHSLRNAGRVQCATDDVVSYTGQVLNSSSADKDNAMLLQVVAYAGNIAGDLDTVGKTDSGDFTERRVGLLGSGRLYNRADASLLGGALVSGDLLQRIETLLQSGRLGLVNAYLPALSDELVKSGHDFTSV